MKVLFLLILIILAGCNPPGTFDFGLSRPSPQMLSVSDVKADLDPRHELLLALPFSGSPRGAIDCQLRDLSHVSVVSPCVCFSESCQVKVAADPQYEGDAEFHFVLIDKQGVSNTGHVKLKVQIPQEPPVPLDLMLSDYLRNTERLITLSYTDVNADQAVSCSLVSLSNLVQTTACQCVGGVCSVGVTGSSNYVGDVSFQYTISDTFGASVESEVSYSLIYEPMVPVAQNLSLADSFQDTERIIELSYTDSNGDIASSCTLSSLSNLTISSPCACSSGVCEVGVTGTVNYVGDVSFGYSITDKDGTSNQATVSYRLVKPPLPPVAQNLTASAVERGFEKVVTLPYTDANSNEAISCSLKDYPHLSISTPCQCLAGVCSVGVTDDGTRAGKLTFSFTVSDNDGESNTAVVDFKVNAPFITVWDTSKPGVTTSNTIRVPLRNGTSYNFEIHWGDDQSQIVSGSNLTMVEHTYASAGVYRVRITGTFPRIHFNNAGDRQKIMDIESWGSIEWTSFEQAFWGCSNLVMTAPDIPDLSKVTSMAQAFQNNSKLIGNNWNWDTRFIENMSSMFTGATLFNGDVSGWRTDNLKTISSMFQNAPAFNQELGAWNTSQVTNFSAIFYGATNFNKDISKWKTGKGTNFAYLFYNAKAFNQDISQWNTTSATTFYSMFEGATAFNQDISEWYVSNVTNMYGMFRNAASFNHDLSGWDVDQVTSRSLFDTGATAWQADFKPIFP